MIFSPSIALPLEVNTAVSWLATVPMHESGRPRQTTAKMKRERWHGMVAKVRGDSLLPNGKRNWDGSGSKSAFCLFVC